MGRLPRQLLSALLIFGLLSCNAPPKTAAKRPGDTTRYRLLLRENPVSPRDASICYNECRLASTPKRYLDCLETCPGFEITPGEYCSPSEVPPVAACMTVRKIPATNEPPPGLLILYVVGAWAFAIAATSLCSSPSTQCGMAIPPPQ